MVELSMSRFNVAAVSTLLGIKSANPNHDFNWRRHGGKFTFKSCQKSIATNRPQEAEEGKTGEPSVLLW